MVKQPGFKSWWGHDASFVMFCAPCGSCAMVTVWVQFWGFHSGSGIWCCLFLAGSVPNLSLYGTSAVVRPCTAVDCVVSLLKAYIIRTQPCQPAEKMAAVSHLPSLNSTFRSSLVALKFPGVFRHAKVQHHTWGFQQRGYM